MDHYQELGLTPSASAGEIREAWRNLVRLLHPDHQQDPALKRLAECQMKRINEIHRILSDPELRRRYDATLKEVAAPVIVQPPPAPRAAAPPPGRAGTVLWIAAALAGFVLVGWFLIQDAGTNWPAAPTDETVAAREAVRPIGFGGVWLYPRATTVVPPRLHSAEYIETVIELRDGVIRGRYRAPEVSFAFQGRAQGNTASLPWTAESGARGNVQLRLVSSNSLEVTWTATRTTGDPRLTSGTAVLARQTQP